MFKLALDCGHGYNCYGKRTPDGVREWTLNSGVGNRIEKLLASYKDVEVFRLDDITGKTDVTLTTRMNEAVNKGVDILVSIHHNADPNASGAKYGTATGVEIWVNTNSSTTTKSIAKSIVDSFAKKSGMKNRGVKTTANLAMVRVKPFPTMLVEGGFMNARPDRDKLETDAYQNAYAEAVVETLVSKFGLKKKGSATTTTPSEKHYEATANLNLRKTASTNGEVIITIPKGTTVNVLDKSTDWYKVSVTIKKKKYTGYAFGRTYINLVK